MPLEEQIDAHVGEVRTDTFDMSFGEIVSLHKSKELIIQPEYQRLFRWSDQKKSQLIESILLELPIPQIFVIENQNGVLELIDGLQRTSSIIQFIEPDSIDMDPLVLDGCALVKDLNGYSFSALPLSLRLRLKRSPIRTVVIKKQSRGFLRYEMFKRLNTGGENLEPQEIRNCSARMVGDNGVRFYTFLVELSRTQDFVDCTKNLPQLVQDKKGLEELVLRFFAIKNSIGNFKGSVRDWLDNYMEGILLGVIDFDYDEEKAVFMDIFNLAKQKLGEPSFSRYRGDEPIGSLPPAYFEAITMGINGTRDEIRGKGADILRAAIRQLVDSNDFRQVTGPGANTREKMERRVALTIEAFRNA